MTAYDIIGDIHGQADKLELLLHGLGYIQRDGVYQWHAAHDHGAHRVIFLGDFIDRGAHNRRVIDIVRPMIEQGHALAVMGNHEFNAICFHTRHPQTGRPLRPHSSKNLAQHRTFLEDYPIGATETAGVIRWFRSLPLYLTLQMNTGAGENAAQGQPTPTLRYMDTIRIVHACWDQRCIDAIAPRLTAGNRLDEQLLLEAAREGTAAFEVVETLLKGPEIALPHGASFRDKDEVERHRIRIKWWVNARTYRAKAMVPTEQQAAVPDLALPARYRPALYPDSAPPVFFGHYWMSGTPRVQRHNVACLDYSAGKGGPLVAYRLLAADALPGGRGLRADRFLSSKGV